MWKIISILILTIEALLLLGFVIGRFQKRKLNEAALFIGAVFVVNFALHLVPFLYRALALGEKLNIGLGLIGCLGASLKLFVGEPNVDAIAAFSDRYTLFTAAYGLGLALALLTTISTAIEAFRNSVSNGFRLAKALKQANCDIVIGNSPNALHYVKTCNSVLLLDDSISRDTTKELIEDGYVVLRKNFTEKLLAGHLFNTTTRYNIICPSPDQSLSCIDTFIAYKKTETIAKHTYLYIELENDEAETLRQEVIEKNALEAYINTFSTNELLARTFAEEHPVTKYLPAEYIEEAAIKKNAEIQVFLLGFQKRSRELYRQLILNNQLVTFDGEYKVKPVNYCLCDTDIDATAWNIGGLAEALKELNGADCFPLPEMPFQTTVIAKAPDSHQVLTTIKKQVRRENCYTLIIIDTDNDCRNIALGAKLKSLLFDAGHYHIFVRSEAAYTRDDAVVTYFGRSDSILNHDVIVNDSLSVMAKKLNEVYTARYAGEEERNRPDFAEYIQKKAEADWIGLDYFTLYSNIYSAMNLRVKLNLLGLDYRKDGSSEGTDLIEKRYGNTTPQAYGEYFKPSVRNALIAQEHARWNAYHLLNEYLPLEKNSITVKPGSGKKARFQIKNTAAKKHACLTTFTGLNDLSAYLAEKAGNGCTAADYDYYIYDEMHITSAAELLQMLGYCVSEK